MKATILHLMMVLLLSFAGLTTVNAQERYSDWLYLRGDKPIQRRYFKVKEENGRVYFKMQLKYDKTTSVYCQRCPGYTVLITRGLPGDADGYQLYYKFYQTDAVITLDHVFSVKKLSDDNYWKSYWDEEKSSPMVLNKSTSEITHLNFATTCVDSFKDDGVEEFNRCKRDFEGLKPVVVDNE